MHMGDPGLSFEDPGAFQLDVLGIEVVEEPAPLAQEHRDEMYLELVENTGGERELCDRGAVDQHIVVARSVLGPGDRGADVARRQPPFGRAGSRGTATT